MVLRSICEVFRILEGIWASLGALWAPLGARGPPKGIHWAKNWFVWPPLLRVGGHFGIICGTFFRLKTRTTIYWFVDPLCNRFGLCFSLIFEDLLNTFPLMFLINSSIRFCTDLGILGVVPNRHFCNTFHAKSSYFEFDQVAKLKQSLQHMWSEMLQKLNEQFVQILV